MAAPAVTVVVPFHNAADTIERTVRSLAGQSAADELEVVFVDDGSTDRSGAILRQLIRTFDRFPQHSIIDFEFRQGVAEATRRGFAEAQGEWVIRCDADDYLVPDAFARMIRAGREACADVVWCGIARLQGGHRSVLLPSGGSESLNDAPVNTLQFSLCNKLLRRSMLEANSLELFQNVDCWEDLGLVSRVFALCPRIVCIDEPLYVYVLEPGRKSLSRSKRDILLRDHLMCALLLEQWFVEQGVADKYEEFLTRLKFIAKVKFLRGRGKDVAQWKATFPEVNPRIMGIRHVSLIHRLLFAAVAKLPTRFTQRVADIIDRIF